MVSKIGHYIVSNKLMATKDQTSFIGVLVEVDLDIPIVNFEQFKLPNIAVLMFFIYLWEVARVCTDYVMVSHDNFNCRKKVKKHNKVQ